jgi:outer membrane protein
LGCIEEVQENIGINDDHTAAIDATKRGCLSKWRSRKMNNTILKIRTVPILFIGMTITAVTCIAADIPDKTDGEQILTLESAVAIALDNHPRIRAAKEGINVAKEASGEFRSSYYPELSIKGGYSRWGKHAFLPSGLIRPDVPSTIGPSDDWTAALQMRYLLFDSGHRRAELQAALARLEKAKEETEKVRQDIALLVHQAYFNLAAAQEIETAAHKRLERAEDHLSLAAARKEAGDVSRADVIRAQVDVAEARLSLEKIKSVVFTAKGNLNTTMGIPAETPVNIDRQQRDIAPPNGLRIDEAIELAVGERPEIQAIRKQIDAATQEMKAARSLFGPKLRAEGGFGWEDEQFLPHDKNWVAGISIELPIFTGFSLRHQLERKKSELSQVEYELEALKLEIRQEVWEAFAKLRETFERIHMVEVLVRDAQESVRLAQERYNAGAGTIADLLDSEAALARADATKAEAIWNYHTANSIFQRATGQLLIKETSNENN